MSGAIRAAIAGSAELRAIGVGDPDDHVLTDFFGETIGRGSMTVVLRWGGEQYQRAVKTGPRDLDVWVHAPVEWGNDYTRINRALAEITKILENMPPDPGEDGVSVTEAVKVSASGHLNDPGFETIARYTSYRVQLRQMV